MLPRTILSGIMRHLIHSLLELTHVELDEDVGLAADRPTPDRPKAEPKHAQSGLLTGWQQIVMIVAIAFARQRFGVSSSGKSQVNVILFVGVGLWSVIR